MSEFYSSYLGETGVMPAKPAREQLLDQLTDLKTGDPEEHHHTADMLLLAYIGDEEITKRYLELERWYA